MKKSGEYLLLALLFVPCSDYADGFIDDILEYGFESGSTTQVYVWGLKNSSATSITIPETVVYEYTDYNDRDDAGKYKTKHRTCTVGRIRDEAFKSKTSLCSVTINDGLINIGASTFANCSSLTNVSMHGVASVGENAFRVCTSLHSITMPHVTSIGRSAFEHCYLLEDATMPCATNIGIWAFAYCYSLKSIEAPSAIRIGKYAFYDCTSLASVEMLEVISIGGDAFENCTSLLSISMPKLTMLGEWAFKECVLLEDVSLPNVISIGNSAFYRCGMLNRVLLPNVTNIYGATFAECGKLTSASLPKVISIGEAAFGSCCSLASIDIPKVKEIGRVAFSGCGLLSNVGALSNVTNVEIEAFLNCSSLLSVAMPEVISIGARAFSKCSSLKSVMMPRVTRIGGGAFSGCISLSSVSVMNMTSMEAGTFNGCISLLTVEMPNVTTIASSVFNGCSSLMRIEMPCIENVGDYAFKSCSSLEGVAMPLVTNIGYEAFMNCSSLTNALMPNVVRFGVGAFTDCLSLTQISLPNKTNNVEISAFCGCSSLTNVSMPKIAGVGECAFYGCKSLANVTMPKSVVEIWGYAFYGCSSLTNVYFEGNPPNVRGSYPFGYVKSGATGTYTAAHKAEWEAVINSSGYWKGLKMQMRESPSLPPLTLTAESADWSSGSITLKCEDPDTSGAAHTYSLEYKENDAWVSVNDVAAMNVSRSADGFAHLTDATFWSRLGGIPPVEYRVKDENGRVSEPCVTRNRFLLAVGYTAYDRRYISPLDLGRPKAYGATFDDAKDFKELCLSRGKFVGGYCRLIENARTAELRGAIQAFALLSSPGDVFLFYISTHGSDNSVFSDAKVTTYDSNYSVEQLHEDILQFKSSVAVVNIICTCHSAAMIGKDVHMPDWIKMWFTICGFRSYQGNVAWIASCNTSQETFAELFGDIFVRDGWQGGYADRHLHGTEYEGGNGDGKLTLGELGRYARVFACGSSDQNPSEVQLKNEGLLDRIVMEDNVTSASLLRPESPVDVSVSQGMFDDRILVSWTPSPDAKYYRIYRYPVGEPQSLSWIDLRIWRNAVDSIVGIDDKLKGFDAVEMMQPFARYGYRVQAINQVGYSEMSEITASSSGWRGTVGYQVFLIEGLAFLTGSSEASINETINDYAVVESAIAPNGQTYGASYVAGLDPTNENSKFTASLSLSNGVPTIVWTPDLGGNRTYTIYGKESLSDEEWISPTNSTHRFFKVEVEMP